MAKAQAFNGILVELVQTVRSPVRNLLEAAVRGAAGQGVVQVICGHIQRSNAQVGGQELLGTAGGTDNQTGPVAHGGDILGGGGNCISRRVIVRNEVDAVILEVQLVEVLAVSDFLCAIQQIHICVGHDLGGRDLDGS